MKFVSVGITFCVVTYSVVYADQKVDEFVVLDTPVASDARPLHDANSVG